MKHLKYILILTGVVVFALAFADNPLRSQLNGIQDEYHTQFKDIKAACKRIGRKSDIAYTTGDFTEFNESETWFKNTYSVTAKDTCFTINQTELDIVVHHTALLSSEYPEQLDVVAREHAKNGYAVSCKNITIAYHFFIGTDGSLKQTRCLYERALHTRNKEESNKSISIVVAGNFEVEEPTLEQLNTLQALISKLQQDFTGEVGYHRMYSPTQCAGKYLNEWIEENYPIQKLEYGAAPVVTQEERDHIAKSLAKGELLEPDLIKYYRTYHEEMTLKPLASFDAEFSNYYSPEPNQDDYLSTWLDPEDTDCDTYKDTKWVGKGGLYGADKCINTHGDPLSTADGTRLHNGIAGEILACPPSFLHGTKIYIEDYGIARCADRGSLIIDGALPRFDVWQGSGDFGRLRTRDINRPHGKRRVTIVQIPN